MLHTLDTKEPIIDRKVLKLLQMPAPAKRSLDPLLNHYAQYRKVIRQLLREHSVKKLLGEFEKALPQLKAISRVKKLDFILWQFKP